MIPPGLPCRDQRCGAARDRYYGLCIEASGAVWREDTNPVPVDTDVAVPKRHDGDVPREPECEPRISRLIRTITIAVYDPCALPKDPHAIKPIIAPFRYPLGS